MNEKWPNNRLQRTLLHAAADPERSSTKEGRHPNWGEPPALLFVLLYQDSRLQAALPDGDFGAAIPWPFASFLTR